MYKYLVSRSGISSIGSFWWYPYCLGRQFPPPTDSHHHIFSMDSHHNSPGPRIPKYIAMSWEGTARYIVMWVHGLVLREVNELVDANRITTPTTCNKSQVVLVFTCCASTGARVWSWCFLLFWGYSCCAVCVDD